MALLFHFIRDALPVNSLERAGVNYGEQEVFIRLVVPLGTGSGGHDGCGMWFVVWCGVVWLVDCFGCVRRLIVLGGED
jgi:hypothetical protein